MPACVRILRLENCDQRTHSIAIRLSLLTVNLKGLSSHAEWNYDEERTCKTGNLNQLRKHEPK